MFGQAYPYDPAQHILMDPPLLDWCRRNCEDPRRAKRLFFYRHTRHGTFVVAEWLSHPKGLFVDLMNLGPSMHCTRDRAQQFLRGCNGKGTARDLALQIRQSQSDHLHALQDENAELQENAERRRRLFP